MNTWAEFALLTWLLTMLPGIDTAQVLRSSVKGGPKLAYLTLFGIMGGVWFWGIAAALGVSAILLASETAYTIFKFVGATYLLYLGISMIRQARTAQGLVLSSSPSFDSPFRALTRAFMVTFTNPKNGAFYVAVLPQFMPEDMNPLLAGVIFSTIHNACVLIWFSGVILLTHKARAFFARPKVGKSIENLSGLALILFGISLFFE